MKHFISPQQYSTQMNTPWSRTVDFSGIGHAISAAGSLGAARAEHNRVASEMEARENEQLANDPNEMYRAAMEEEKRTYEVKKSGKRIYTGPMYSPGGSGYSGAGGGYGSIGPN